MAAKASWNAAATKQLHKAAAEGDLNGVCAALQNKANVCALNPEDENTPLIAATYGSFLEVVERLLSEPGIKIKQTRPSDGKTVLHVAAEEGHAEVVAALLKACPDLRTLPDMDGWLPLHWAAYYGDHKIARQLLSDDSQQQVAATTFSGNTPLQLGLQMCGSKWSSASSRESDYGVLLKLLDAHGANASSWRCVCTGGSALHEIIRNGGSVGCLQAAIDLGTDINTTTTQQGMSGVTALHLAVAQGSCDLAAALLAAGADTEVREAEAGCTPLLLAAQAGQLQLLPLLLQHKADPTVFDNQGMSVAALLLLGCEEEQQAVQSLPAVLEAIDSWDENASGTVNSASSLAQGTAPTALHIAASKGWSQVAALCIQASAKVQAVTGDVHSRDPQGNTPLHAVIRSMARRQPTHERLVKVVEQLCNAGADFFAANNAGQSPDDLLKTSCLPGCSADFNTSDKDSLASLIDMLKQHTIADAR